MDLDPSRSPETKHLPAVYQMLTRNTERQLTALFEKLPLDHPARAPYNLFAQSSDTVRSGIIQGLGTRLQVLQNREVQGITSRSDIDLAAPASKRCAYYIILSDQDTTMAFLSSLFFSLMFIKLTRYADARPGGHCDIPVNLILDEFNNIGRIGGAADGSDFARSLSVIRSRDIRVMMAVQSLGQGQGRRKLLTTDEVLRLPNTELLCIVRGCNILKLNKLDYTKHPMAEMMVSVSIMDYQPQVSPYKIVDKFIDKKMINILTYYLLRRIINTKQDIINPMVFLWYAHRKHVQEFDML